MAEVQELKNKLRKTMRGANLNTALGEAAISEEIGEGGNGLVFSATLHNEQIAIKFLANGSRDKLTRFKAEYLNVLLLPENESIAKPLFYEEYDIEGRLYPAIFFRKYNGHLKRPEAVTLENTTAVFSFLLDALEFIHNNGIIHRDLKPDNILLNGATFVISDFGIASYNPEVFHLKADTREGERIANRLFSAPEQETPGSEAHPTMDIFALGQILHWYVTGNVHKGTHRVSFEAFIPDSSIYDSIVEKCLAQEPRNRFQSIGDIREFLANADKKKRWKEEYYYDDPWRHLYPFSEALAATFPRGISKVSFTDDEVVINRLLENLVENCNPLKDLWWVDSEDGSNQFELRKISNDVWLFGNDNNGDEVSVKSAWAYFDNSIYSDFLILNFKPMPPFGIYERDTLESYNTSRKEMLEKRPDAFSLMLMLAKEEAALVDNQYYVSSDELSSGYAETANGIIKLSEHDVGVRMRTLEERSAVVGTQFHSILQSENTRTVVSYLAKHNGGNGMTKASVLELLENTRINRHYLVSATM